MQLHLGVLDIPYHNEPGRNAPSQTTGDVAEILEHKYAIMEDFVRVHEDDIAKAMEQSLGDAFELLLKNAPPEPLTAGMSIIETAFRQFLLTQEVERIGIPGTPTKAALKGVNHRKRHPYAKSNPRRPSFIDTGTYETSFRAWVD